MRCYFWGGWENLNMKYVLEDDKEPIRYNNSIVGL